MKKIVGFLILILFSTSFLTTEVLAARKRIRGRRARRKTARKTRFYGGALSSVKLRADRRALLVNLSNMGNLVAVSYELTYLANGVSQGVVGSIDPALEPAAFRELLFGTCSAGVCTYHTNISNMRLKIISKLKSGLTIIKPYRIRP